MDLLLERRDRPRAVVPEERHYLVHQEPPWRHRHADGRAVTAPLPRCRMLDEPRLDRITDNVGERADEVCHALDLHRARPMAEEMVKPPMPAIGAPCVPSVELLEAGGELLLGRVKDDVVVVRHQAPGIDLPLELRSHAMKLVAEGHAVLSVPNDPPAIVAAAEDVIRLGSIYRAQPIAHGEIVAKQMSRECAALPRYLIPGQGSVRPAA